MVSYSQQSIFLENKDKVPEIQFTVGAIAFFYLVLRILFPNYFEAARCVGVLPNGDLVKARGEECKNPAFESVVIFTLDEDGNVVVEGDAVFGP